MEAFQALRENDTTRLHALITENPGLCSATEDSYGLTVLHFASQSGMVDIVKLILSLNRDNIDVQDFSGNTPLLLCSGGKSEAQIQTANVLIQGGANANIPNKETIHPLHLAAKNLVVPTLRSLLSKNANPIPLHTKISTISNYMNYSLQLKSLHPLSKYDTNPMSSKITNGPTPLQYALMSKEGDPQSKLDAVKVLVEYNGINNDNAIATLLAYINHCRENELHSQIVSTLFPHGLVGVKTLLKKEESSEESGDNNEETALTLAASRGIEPLVSALLECGVSIDECNSQGQTALLIASSNGHTAVVSTLLNRGASPNIQDTFGRVAFHEAVQFGHEDAVHQLFLNCNNQININGKAGYYPQRTALHTASMNGDLPIVDFLLEHGALLNIKDQEGDLPVDVAANDETRDFLQCHIQVKCVQEASFVVSIDDLGSVLKKVQSVFGPHARPNFGSYSSVDVIENAAKRNEEVVIRVEGTIKETNMKIRVKQKGLQLFRYVVFQNSSINNLREAICEKFGKDVSNAKNMTTVLLPDIEIVDDRDVAYLTELDTLEVEFL
eukprot:TRINITY_DN5061_c0_g1_i1.p1 TRINITY_DN5061_c0_g1~~TRINITY_DN5061_c0_g1_i1.p1  ORF type:complete len:556 (-),score=120.37 TRINITY_DN5061_c0_g1_i1:213-1880(-)